MNLWLTFIQDCDKDYVDLGIACGDICRIVDRALRGRRLDELNESVLGAIEELTKWVEPLMHKLSSLKPQS